jgi:glycosyltransferase 2 family protein
MRASTQRVVFAAGLLVSGVCAWLALRDARWLDLRAAFALAKLWVALPFLLVLAAFYWLKALRWERLLAPAASVPARALLPSLVVGFAANNVLPAHLGELIRVYLLGRERGIPKSAVLATVVLERLFDVLAVLGLAVVALADGRALGPELRAAGLFLAAVAVAVALPAALLVFRTQAFLRLAGPLLARLPDGLRTRAGAQLEALASGFGGLRAGHRLWGVVANSCAQWILMATCVWLAIAAFGLDVPWTAAVVVLVLVVAGITLPGSPGFVGTIEYCFVLGLGAWGVTAGTALSVALFYHALTWTSVTLAGAWYLRRYGLTWRKLGRAAVTA